jgi:hypothetical protein
MATNQGYGGYHAQSGTRGRGMEVFQPEYLQGHECPTCENFSLTNYEADHCDYCGRSICRRCRKRTRRGTFCPYCAQFV